MVACSNPRAEQSSPSSPEIRQAMPYLKACMSLFACQPSGTYRVNRRDSGCKNGLLITEIWDILYKLLESVSLGGDGESDAWRPFNFFGGPLFLWAFCLINGRSVDPAATT
jgi:hypothetical protein